MYRKVIYGIACGALLAASAALTAEEEKKDTPTYVKVEKVSIEFCGS